MTHRRPLRKKKSLNSTVVEVADTNHFRVLGVVADEFHDSIEEINGFLQDDTRTGGGARTRIGDLEKLWLQLKRAYEEAMVSDEDPPEEEDTITRTMARTLFKRAIQAFQNSKTQLQEVIDLSRSQNANDSQQENTEHNFKAKGLKLPPCEIPSFSGSYHEWPAFRDLFTVVYIKNPLLTKAECLFYLREKVKDKALLLIKHYPLTNESFPLAWESLKSRYENKRVLVDMQLKKLLNLQPVTKESGEAIKLCKLLLVIV